MSNYNSLKATIDANIKQNGNQEITGQILNSVLNQMVTTLGAGYQFAGVATINTNPGTPDAKVFYIANGKGTYEKFGGINVTEDEVVVLYWDTAWHKVATGIASQAKLSELEEKVDDVIGVTTIIDLDNTPLGNGIIENGVWVALASSNYKHIAVPVNGGIVKIHANSSVVSQIAFLSDYVSPVADQPAFFCQGESIRNLPPDVERIFPIPDDCMYLYVRMANAIPQGVSVIKEGELDKFSKQVDELESKTDKIEQEDITEKSQSISVKKDDGTEVVGIDENGVSVNGSLKVYGEEVAMKSDILYKKEEVQEPIDSEFIISNDAEDEVYIKIGKYGIKAKDYLRIDGKPIYTDKKLSILAIGNSYTLDSFSYLPILAGRYGVKMEVYMFYQSGMSLATLDSIFNSNTSSVYKYDNETGSSWVEIDNQTPQALVSMQKWDVISIQQDSVSSLDASSFTFADSVVRKIFDNITAPCVLAWNININRNDSSKGTNTEQAEQILTNIKSTIDRIGLFDLVLPYGTAIFNARTNTTLDSIGNNGHLWGDNIHLQEGVPCYIATLANLEAIFRKFYPYLSVFGDDWRPTTNAGWNIQNAQEPFIPVTDDLSFLAQRCAIKANDDKFNISTI